MHLSGIQTKLTGPPTKTFGGDNFGDILINVFHTRQIAILSHWFMAINAESSLEVLAKNKASLKAQADYSVVIIFWAAAAITVAGQEIQISIGIFGDVTQATELTVE